MHGKSVGVDPWLLWGSSHILSAAGNANPPQQRSPQIVNIDYHHPTTWRFMLAAKGVGFTGPAPITSCMVDFDLQFGVGRSNVYIPKFCHFELPATDFTTSLDSHFCCAVDIPAPAVAGLPVPSQRVDVIPAQSIQATAILTAGPSGATVFQVEVGCYFAPSTHVRPEWFAGQFGSEMGGR